MIDRHEVDLVIHGHAHRGNTHGRTPGGTVVRNTAKNVVREIQYFDVDDLVRSRQQPDLGAIA